MITLNLAIYEGDFQLLNFDTTEDLMEYIQNLDQFDCIWLICGGDEIFVTENINKMYEYIRNGFFFILSENNTIHIHEYQTYEDAYKVALDMREENPKCYN